MKRILLIAMAVTVAACDASHTGEVVPERISVVRAQELAQEITHEKVLTAPLVAIFDPAGRLVGHQSGWHEGAQTSVEILTTQDGSGPSLATFLQSSQASRAGVDMPTLLTISIKNVCEPCTRMESEIAALHEASRVRWIRLQIEPTPRA